MKLSEKSGKTNRTGSYGEGLAVSYLLEKGYSIIDRNYSKKWGEIDIIAQKDITIHFVEVKSVSHETKQQLQSELEHGYQPAEMVTAEKLKRLQRTIDSWCLEHKYTGIFQLDVVTVRMVPRETYALIECISDVSI